jgi:hypothetical protein
VFFVGVHNVLRWREQGNMHVLHIANGHREVTEVIPFGKARKLGDVVQPNIDQALDPRVFEPSEERLCRLFCETNGKNLHSATLLTALGSGAPSLAL